MLNWLPLAITIVIIASILIQALFCPIAVVTIAKSERHFQIYTLSSHATYDDWIY